MTQERLHSPRLFIISYLLAHGVYYTRIIHYTIIFVPINDGQSAKNTLDSTRNTQNLSEIKSSVVRFTYSHLITSLVAVLMPFVCFSNIIFFFVAFVAVVALIKCKPCVVWNARYEYRFILHTENSTCAVVYSSCQFDLWRTKTTKKNYDFLTIARMERCTENIILHKCEHKCRCICRIKCSSRFYGIFRFVGRFCKITEIHLCSKNHFLA